MSEKETRDWTTVEELGGGGSIFKERILRIQVPESSISYDFLLCFFFFSGLFCNLPE